MSLKVGKKGRPRGQKYITHGIWCIMVIYSATYRPIHLNIPQNNQPDNKLAAIRLYIAWWFSWLHHIYLCVCVRSKEISLDNWLAIWFTNSMYVSRIIRQENFFIWALLNATEISNEYCENHAASLRSWTFTVLLGLNFNILFEATKSDSTRKW